MTCAKREVTCALYDSRGRLVAEGSNDCLMPQPTCPRNPGDGYEKCWDICRQPAHAEVAALVKAAEWGFDVRGGTAVVRGHERACEHCRTTLTESGITDIRFTA